MFKLFKANKQVVHKKSLETIINNRAEELQSQIIDRGGSPTKEDIEEIDRLAKLHQLSQVAGAVNKKDNFKPASIIPVVTTLIIVATGYLVFSSVTKQGVSINVTTYSVSFEWDEEDSTANINFVKPTEFLLKELREIVIQDTSYRVHNFFSDGRSFDLTNLPLKKGTIITISYPARSKSYWLSLKNIAKNRPVSIFSPKLNGKFVLRKNYSPLRPSQYLSTDTLSGRPLEDKGEYLILSTDGTIYPIDLYPKTDSISFLIGFDEAEELLTNIKVKNLVLDEIVYPSKSNTRVKSMIQSGYVKLLSLGDQKYDFEPGEHLEIDGCQGILNGLSIDKSGIKFVFTGEVEAMKANSRSSPINLMPSKMEWLQANKGLQLLFGTTLAAIGLIVSAIRWFKNPH